MLVVDNDLEGQFSQKDQIVHGSKKNRVPTCNILQKGNKHVTLVCLRQKLVCLHLIMLMTLLCLHLLCACPFNVDFDRNKSTNQCS